MRTTLCNELESRTQAFEQFDFFFSHREDELLGGGGVSLRTLVLREVLFQRDAGNLLREQILKKGMLVSERKPNHDKGMQSYLP
jgi:hypothetical protein